jgi:hypothetical protein
MKADRTHRRQLGQALVEYVVLIPPMLLLSFMILIPLSSNTANIFCAVNDGLSGGNGGSCSVEAPQGIPMSDEGEQVASTDPTPTPEGEASPAPEPDPEPTPEEPVCVVLEEDTGSSQCEQSGVCAVLPGLNEATYTSSEPIATFVIKAGREYHMFSSGLTDDGCYLVEISGNTVSWQKYAGGRDCKDVSHGQAWQVPLCGAPDPQ